MFPEKKMSSLEDILNTIRRGDEYDCEDIARRVGEELSKAFVSEETASLCCDVIEALARKKKISDRLAPMILGMDLANLQINTDITLRAVKVFHEGLKKEKLEDFDRDTLNLFSWPEFSANMLEICADDKTNAVSKACIDLYKTMAQTPAAEKMAESLTMKVDIAREFYSPEEVLRAVTHLAPFATCVNKEASFKVKKYLKEFFDNYSAPTEQMEEQTRLLNDVRKSLPAIK